MVGERRNRTDLQKKKKNMSKKGLFKVAHRGIHIARSGAKKMEDNTIEV